MPGLPCALVVQEGHATASLGHAVPREREVMGGSPSNAHDVIPERAERASPEAILTGRCACARWSTCLQHTLTCGYGFRACAFGASRNDDLLLREFRAHAVCAPE